MDKPIEINHSEKTLTVENDEVLFSGIMGLPTGEQYKVIMNGERVGIAVKRLYSHSPDKLELNYYPDEPVKSVSITGKVEL